VWRDVAPLFFVRSKNGSGQFDLWSWSHANFDLYLTGSSCVSGSLAYYRERAGRDTVGAFPQPMNDDHHELWQYGLCSGDGTIVIEDQPPSPPPPPPPPQQQQQP
jgi:hypothetical protein